MGRCGKQAAARHPASLWGDGRGRHARAYHGLRTARARRFRNEKWKENAPVLSALIGVNQRTPWPSRTHCHQDRVEHELAVDGRARSPADDFSREEIHHHGKVKPALPGANARSRHSCFARPSSRRP
jgi:hypothetical protein